MRSARPFFKITVTSQLFPSGLRVEVVFERLPEDDFGIASSSWEARLYAVTEGLCRSRGSMTHSASRAFADHLSTLCRRAATRMRSQMIRVSRVKAAPLLAA